MKAIGREREFAAIGGLASFGEESLNLYRRMAAHVDKIMKGTPSSRSRSNKRRNLNWSLIKNGQSSRPHRRQRQQRLVASTRAGYVEGKYTAVHARCVTRIIKLAPRHAAARTRATAKMGFPDPAVSTGFVHQLLSALPNIVDAACGCA